MRFEASTVLGALVVLSGVARSEETLAWIAFESARETYRDVPYLWLGRQEIEVTVDVKPAVGHALELLWGAKDDRRNARLTVNEVAIDIESGGYDGFLWHRVSLPDPTGDGYRIHLGRLTGKAAFIAAVRLVPSSRESKPDDGELPMGSHRMRLETAASNRSGVFPEMQRIWDGAKEPPAAVGEFTPEEALFRQAGRHARQANEQFFRCRRFVEGWLSHADPETGLIPRNLSQSRDIWNAQDAAADNDPFMVMTAAITDRALFDGRMRDMLRTETRLTSRVDRLPDIWSFSKRAFATDEPDLPSIIFGGSEYVKDGLLPLTEWLGPSPWSERMMGIVDDLWKHALIETPYGNLPSRNVEVNGEMLQSLSRIFWMSGDERYLDLAIRLGDWHLLGGHHPTRDFESLRLRDHGCEIVSGLAELYVAVHHTRPEKKAEYRGPIHAMFDRILEVGRDEHGMLWDTIDPRSGSHSRGFCDTWGYNYDGIYSVYLVDGTEAYRGAVRRVLSNLEEHLANHDWGSADEYADSIEGALNLHRVEPIASTARVVRPHVPPKCEHCHAALPSEPDPGDPVPTRHQVWELRERPCEITEHQGHGRVCRECGHLTRARIPAEVAGSCVRPRLAATASLLTGGFQISRRQVEGVFVDVLGVPISVGTIANLEKEMSAALEVPHERAGEHVRDAAAKNLDETSWKKKGRSAGCGPQPQASSPSSSSTALAARRGSRRSSERS